MTIEDSQKGFVADNKQSLVEAAVAFLDYFKEKHHGDKLYISVSLENTVARKMYTAIGFEKIEEIEYTFLGMHFREMQMVKKW